MKHLPTMVKEEEHCNLVPSATKRHVTTGSLKTDKITLEGPRVDKKVRWNETVEHRYPQRDRHASNSFTINALTQTHDKDEPQGKDALKDKDVFDWWNSDKKKVGALEKRELLEQGPISWG